MQSGNCGTSPSGAREPVTAKNLLLVVCTLHANLGMVELKKETAQRVPSTRAADTGEMSISERELRRRTISGELPSIGKGRLRRYAIEDLRAYMHRNRNG